MSMTAALGETAARAFLDACHAGTLRFGEAVQKTRGLSFTHVGQDGVEVEVVKSLGSYRVHMVEDGERVATFSCAGGIPAVSVGGRFLRVPDAELSDGLVHAVGRIAAAAEAQRGNWGAPFTVWAGRSDRVGVEAFREADGTSWWLLDTAEAREADREFLGHTLGRGANGSEAIPRKAVYLSLRESSGERLASALVDADGVLDLVEREGFESDAPFAGPMAVGRRIAAGEDPSLPLAEGMHRTDDGTFWVDGTERLHNLHGPAEWSSATGSVLYAIGGRSMAADGYALAAAEAASAASPARDGIMDTWLAERITAEIDFMVEEMPDEMFLQWNSRRDAEAVAEAIRASALDSVEEVSAGVRKFLSNDPMNSFFLHALARGWIRQDAVKGSDLAFTAGNNGAPQKVVDLMARAGADEVHGLNARLHMAIETGRWGDLTKEADASAPPRRGLGC